MTKENFISFYINHAIEELRSQLKETEAVDMILLFGNALFDLSCKLTADRDLGAINPYGKIHPSVDILDQVMKWIYIPRHSPTLTENYLISSRDLSRTPCAGAAAS
jgi:hypothetical protein